MHHPHREVDVAPPARRTRPSAAQVLVVSVVYLGCWSVLDVLAAQFEASPGVSVWYPPPGLDVALLLALGLRWWPLLVASSVLHVLVISPDEISVPAGILYAGVTVGGYAGGAAILLRVFHIDPRLPTQRDVVWLVTIAAGAAALVVCATRVVLLGAVGVPLQTSLVLNIASNWAGSATGIAMLTPVLLLLARRLVTVRHGAWASAWTSRPPLDEAPAPCRSWGEQGLQALALLAAVWLAYSGMPGDSLDYTYLVYAPLLWIAVRGGLAPAAGAVLAVNVLAVLLVGKQSSLGGGIALQFGLVTLSVAGLLLGAQVSQRRRDVEAHRHASVHDALTGLANRTLFDERLTAAMARRDADPGHRVGMLFCDLDDFKQVNDSLGHAAGDQVLVEAGRRLAGAVRGSDTVARLGGDEFAVIVDGLEDDSVLPALATEITACLAKPHRLDSVHDRVVVTVSTGSATTDDLTAAQDGDEKDGGQKDGGERGGADQDEVDGTDDGSDPSDGALLMRDADVALNRAKRDGRARHVTFDSAMHASAVRRLDSESALRRALDDAEISVVYQPIVDLTDGRVVAAEALARWTRPDGVVVPPARFTALAETTGLIATLGGQVRALAMADAAGWATADAQGWAAAGRPRLSVNVSGAELTEVGFSCGFLKALGRAGLAPTAVAVEITETVLVRRSAVAEANLVSLAEEGVRIVVDDFGTGFSSFAYVLRLPVTMLKIDRSFVQGLPSDRESSAVVRAILAMAGELGLEVVAEGVSTAAQRDFLREHGCRFGQGFALGYPGNSAALLSAALSPATRG